MKVELKLITPDKCELKAWCVQQFKVKPRKTWKRKNEYDDQPSIVMQCTKADCGLRRETFLPFSGTSIFQAYFEPPKNIENVRKMLCSLK